PYTVVGVMPPAFEIADASEWGQFFVPLAFTAAQRTEKGNNYTVIGRLRANVTAEQLDQDMKSVFEAYRAAGPENVEKFDLGYRAFSYQTAFTGDLANVLWIMLGATLFVLLLACANVTNLVLARAVNREREFAVRTALGAGRGRLVRQVVLEMLVLGVVSAAFAMVASLLALH